MAGSRAVIIGGSMSGLLSALMLRRAGWTVDIYERVESELSGRGAGIVAQRELIERLRGLGLATDALGVHITTRKILDAQGRLTEEIHCPQVLTAWERVYRLLRDAFPPERYHRGRGLAGFELRGRFGAGAVFRWRNDRGRSAGGRRRHALDRAPAGAARARCRSMPVIAPGAR